MLIGYARVSTGNHDPATEIAAPQDAGCDVRFDEKASRGRWDRPELHRLLAQGR